MTEVELLKAALAAVRRECEGLRGALRELRVNMVVATCDGSCLCGNSGCLNWKPAAETGKAEEADLRTAWAAMKMVDDAYWGEFCGCCGVILSLESQDEECGPQHTAVQLVHDWMEKHPKRPATPAPAQGAEAYRIENLQASLVAAEKRIAELEALLMEREPAIHEAVEDGSWSFRTLLAKLASRAAPPEREGK